MENAKRLYMRDGMGFQAREFTNSLGRSIEIYEDGDLTYTVVKGNRHTEHLIILPGSESDPNASLPIYKTMHAVEIYENFEQYYAMLEQIP